MAARIFRLESASELDITAVMDGAGRIGDLIGITESWSITTPRTTLRAGRFITGTPTTEPQVRKESTPPTAKFTTIPAARRPSRSRETPTLREDTPHPLVRKACIPAPTAATTMAERQKAIRREEAPVLVAEHPMAEEHRTAEVAVATLINRDFVMFLIDR